MVLYPIPKPILLKKSKNSGDKMKVFIDTNIFIAVIEESQGSDAGRKLLNKQSWTIGTSTLNLVEVRNVLMKKKHKDADFANTVIDWLKEQLDFVISDPPDMQRVDSVHKSKLLDPMDCLFYCLSNEQNAVLSSLENELTDHGAKHPCDLVST